MVILSSNILIKMGYKISFSAINSGIFDTKFPARLEKIQDNPNFRLESVKRDELLREIKFYEDCPLIELMNFSLVSSKVPDFELYDKLKLRFFENSIELNTEINSNLQNEEEQE